MKSLLTVKQVSEQTGLATSTLNKMRMTGAGPQFVRLGSRRVGYESQKVRDWIEANTHSKTEEYLEK